MKTLIKQKHKYDDKALKAIDTTLRKIFGDEATRVIYRHLEKRYSLRKDEVVEKIDVFAKGLEEILRSGAYAIEKAILEDIYSSYGLTRRLEFERRSDKQDFVNQMKMLIQV
ncbi:MAG: hypothetical protein ACUVRA_03695 [Candidatus Bathyarchaeaceae archaeon]